LGNGWRRRPGIGVTDGRQIEMPAFHRSREAAPMLLQLEQVRVGLSLTTAERRQDLDKGPPSISDAAP